LGSDFDPAWQRYDEVLDLGSDIDQFHPAAGRSSRQILGIASLVGGTAKHHRQRSK